MRSKGIHFYFQLLVFVGAWVSASLFADSVDSAELEVPVVADLDSEVDWRIASADRLLEGGLLGLAEAEYTSVLAQYALGATMRFELQMRLTRAYLMQGKFSQAEQLMRGVEPSFYGDLYHLYAAVVAYGDGTEEDLLGTSEQLALVEVERLPEHALAWYYFLSGAVQRSESGAEYLLALENAMEVATDESQRLFFMSLLLRERILSEPASEGLLSQVRAQWERLRGQSVAFPFAREYIITLYNLGRPAAAVEVVDVELSADSPYGYNEREQLLLLKWLILGVDSPNGREALMEIIRNGQDRDVMAAALQLLGQSRDAVALAELAEFLDLMIARAQPHLLVEQMYYMRGELALARDELELAESDARYLLEQFPGSERLASVYRLFVYAALSKDPPQHRAAADYLIQLREQVGTELERGELNFLIGDCYYLNGDYENAADFYAAAVASGVFRDGGRGLFFRLVSAELNTGDIDSALEYMDASGELGEIDVVDLWRAEWNLARSLQIAGQAAVALERVRVLLEDGGRGAIPAELDLRMRWLEVWLSLQLEDYAGVAERVDFALKRIVAYPEGTLADSESQMLLTELMLLEGEVLLRSEEPLLGLRVLENLRAEYAATSAAVRSFLVESNFSLATGNLLAARNSLIELAKAYPESALAPQALYEAGIIGQKLGPDYYLEATQTLASIEDLYPESPLAFTASLKQGDLLRLLNDFSGAQIIYRNVVNAYPDHPKRYIAELGRADCLLALAGSQAEQLNPSADVLRRLLDLPNLPISLQAEVTYKLGFIFQKQADFEALRSLYANAVSALLLDSENSVQLGDVGRYWMGRILLDLAGVVGDLGEVDEARRVYNKIIAYNLPGKNIAAARVEVLASE